MSKELRMIDCSKPFSADPTISLSQTPDGLLRETYCHLNVDPVGLLGEQRMVWNELRRVGATMRRGKGRPNLPFWVRLRWPPVGFSEIWAPDD